MLPAISHPKCCLLVMAKDVAMDHVVVAKDAARDREGWCSRAKDVATDSRGEGSCEGLREFK